MLSRLLHLVAIVLVWGVKVKDGSRVTPRIFGVFSRGSKEFWQVTWGWEFSCLDHGVKRVTDDLEGAIVRWFCWAQSTTGWKELLRLADSWDKFRDLSGSDSAIVTSSA